MIFMDIIMPRLDGVSATMYIRQSHPAIPIIAMTSNIRPEEVNGYFDHGKLNHGRLSSSPVTVSTDSRK
jgi:osomolarity two-component system, response regulator SKN7